MVNRAIKLARRALAWTTRRTRYPMKQPRETGYNFSRDRSTTRAVAARMENMPFYLRGEVPLVRGA